jgi:hypothetical protein
MEGVVENRGSNLEPAEGNRLPIYHYAIGVCVRFSSFQIYINFDFLTKTDKVMAADNRKAVNNQQSLLRLPVSEPGNRLVYIST